MAQALLRFITLVLVLSGVFFRFKGLGVSPLAQDEYYLANAINRIIQYGLPAFDCGGYYTRGILQQYLTAPFVILGSNDEFYLRIIPAISNILAIYACYLIGRLVVDERTGCLISILMALSLWQIEFARFARMYAPFSALFLWTMYFCLQDLQSDGKNKAKWWAVFLAFTSIFVYEGAIFCVLLLVIVAFMRQSSTAAIYKTTLATLLLFTIIYKQINFRTWGAQTTPFVGNQHSIVKLPIDLPDILLFELDQIPFGVAGFLALAALAAALAISWLRTGLHADREKVNGWLIVGAISALLLSLLNMFSELIGVALIVALLIRAQPQALEVSVYRKLIAANSIFIAISFVFWIYVLHAQKDWAYYLHVMDNTVNLAGQITASSILQSTKLLFGYHQVWDKILGLWYAVMPIQSVILVAIIGGLLWHLLRPNALANQKIVFLLVTLIVSVLLVATLKQPWFSTRYTFFLHPLLIILTGIATSELARSFHLKSELSCVYIPLLLIVLVSEDYDWNHVTHIDGDKYTYRISFSSKKENHFYRRHDVKSVSQYVNINAQSGDTIISTTPAVDYYLKKLDYFYQDRTSTNYRAVEACAGKKHLWSQAGLLGSAAELESLLQDSKSPVWIITFANEYNHDNDNAAERMMKSSFANKQVFRSKDGRLAAYKIIPQ
jgi:uncharacterized membrane protein